TLDQLMHLTENDALLIYFAGHCYYDKQMDEGYWIPYGAQREYLDLPAKEDWLWNSSISRILNALPARHVLLMADTCYGGSLFRGEEQPDKSDHWYSRAMAVPSRYLITSGNLEPVIDSGIRHSVFAQEILNDLQYSDKDIFSASDIAISIREKVSQLTGQLVRMGPLASPANAGGEFVFVRKNAELPPTNPEKITPESETPSETSVRGPLEDLAEKINTHSQNTADGTFIRPRVLACIGPDGGHPEEAALARTRLYESLNKIGGCIVVERESFDAILQEVELGRSNMADARTTMKIGKILPASLILFGELIPIGNTKEIHLRIVDTETSRVLSTSSTSFQNYDELEMACDQLARQIMETMNSVQPLVFKANTTQQGNIQANWGRFHGARMDDSFEIITREGVGTVSQRDISLGTARIITLGEETAEFLPNWNTGIKTLPSNLWLKATVH
ncbi:MAG: hypothetical protein PF495_06420, partial [Spirochaetales bacterium]|nr:hypothetical protein [Spirochaetales bacterium]